LKIRQPKAILITIGLTILLGGCGQPDSATLPDTTAPRFARDLQRVLDLSVRITNGTGISAAVIVPGQGTWTGAAGRSEPSKALAPDMLFDIASIGKNFLAILVCQLAEEGRLSLDDPLSKWLPDYPNVDNSITIRQLLNHTSGLFDWVDHPQSPYRRPFSTIVFEEVSSPEEVLSKLVSGPYFSKGGGFHYSTTNYTLLRMIAEKATGSTVGKEIRTRFLEPLKLSHTFVLDAETRLPETVSVAHAWCEIEGNGNLTDVTSRPVTWIATRSPALMYSTAEDLARWSQAVYGGKILDRTWLEEVLTFHRPTPAAPGEPFAVGYGLGTEELRLGGLVMWGHLGWQYGYTSSMLYVPKRSASIVVLINDNNMMLINLAAIGLCMVTEYHLATVRFLLLFGSALLLLSMFVLWPLSYAASFFRKPREGCVVSTHTKRRKAIAARWIALLAGVSIAGTTILYLGYSLNPLAQLSWSGGTPIVWGLISLSITSVVIAVVLVFMTWRVWKDKLWSVTWRLHYTLVTLAGLIAAFSLLGLLF
jgi:D-alanyl-D-alanine carboxypeptidase